MDFQFMPTQVRRRILERSKSIAGDALGARHPETKLMESFREVCDLEARKIRLLEKGPVDCFFDLHLARLATAQATLVEEMCDVRATTLRGLRARVQAYAFWDAGELPYRTHVAGTMDDVVLDAIVRDLTAGATGDASPGSALRARRG